MLKNILCLSFVSISFFAVLGQTIPDSKPYRSSTEIINEAVALLEKKDSIGYLNKLSEVSTGDTLASAVYLTLVSNAASFKQYELSLKHSTLYIENFPYDSELHQFIQNKCFVLVEMEKYEEAIDYIDRVALKKYPNFTPYFFLKMKALNKLKKYSESQAIEFDLIQTNPYYYYGHYAIGNKYLKSDYVSQAALAILSSILVNPSSDNAVNYLKQFNSLMVNKQEDVGIAKLGDVDKFEKVDILLKNKLALDKNYKVPSKITDGFIKQTHLLLTEVEKMEPSDFESEAFRDFYIPFYKKLMKDGMFENMTYFLFSNEKSFPSQSSKYKKQNEAFSTWMIAAISEICSTDLKASGMKRTYNTSLNYGLEYLGYIKDNNIVGKFTYYRSNGNPSVEGELNASGIKNGTWKWYYEYGTLAKTIDYKNNLINGKKETWNYLGQKSTENAYESDKKSGIEKEFYSDDKLKLEAFYKNDVPNGFVKNYHINGQVSSEFELKEGKIIGEFISYFENGDTNAIEIYSQDGLLNGTLLNYYPNHILKFSGKYENDKRVGTFSWYYANGKLKETSQYSSTNTLTENVDYYVNGKKESISTFNSSEQLDGANQFFNKNGILIHTIYYKNGKISHFENYDKSGKITMTNKKEGSDINFEFYDATGLKLSEGKYNRKDGKEGTWKFYYDNSSLKREEKYIDGRAEGVAISYYQDGIISVKENFKDGELDGYYSNFYVDGALKEEGWFEKGKRVGWRYEYFADGTTLEEASFYVNNTLNGANDDYYFNGQKKSTSFYVYDKLYRIVRYGLDGEIIGEENYNSPNYVINYYFPNGTKFFESHVINEKLNGKKIQYFPNGNLDYEYNFINGNFNGEQKSYYSNGKLYSLKNYILGEINGKSLGYYDSGKANWVSDYVYGIKTAETSYFDNGKTQAVYSFDCNELNGKAVYYSPDGFLEHIRYYDHSRIIGYSYLGANQDTLPMIPVKHETAVVKCSFPNGKASREFILKNGTFEGEYKKYYSTGQIYYKANYIHDEAHGEMFIYDEKGGFVEKENYYYGTLDGEQKYYSNGALKIVRNYKLGSLHGLSQYYQDGILVQEYLYDTGVLIKINK